MKKISEVLGCLLLPWGIAGLTLGCGEVIVGEPLQDGLKGDRSSTGGDQGAPGGSEQPASPGDSTENGAQTVVDLGSQTALASTGIQASPALEHCKSDFSLGYRTTPLVPLDENSRSRLVDVNADGLLDQVFILGGEVRASLLRTTGEYDEPIVSRAQIGSPTGLAAADLDDDGHMDLATASVFDDGTSAVRVLLGNGAGQFSDSTEFETLSLSPGCATGDVNGDGSPELIVGDRERIRFFVHQNDGTFVEQAPLSVQYNSAPVYHDWNGDGALDVVVSEVEQSSAFVLVFMGDGAGQFMLSGRYPVGDFVSVTIGTGDVDGDGVDDLAVDLGDTKGFSPGIAILIGNGDGTFEAPVSYSGVSQYPFPDEDLDSNPDVWEGSPIQSYAQDAIDLNGDGVLDVLVDESLYGAYAELRSEDAREEREIFSPAIPAAGRFLLGNFVGDAHLDLFIGSDASGGFSGTHRNTFAQGDGTGAFVLVEEGVLGGWESDPLWTVDLNEDGLSDWIHFDFTSDGPPISIPPGGPPAVVIQIVRADGTFTENTYPLSARGFAASAGDLNGDGTLDLVVAVSDAWGSSASLDVLFGQGDGTFVSGPTTQVWPTEASLTNVFQLADVDRDGALDAIVEIDGLSTWVLHGDGEGAFPRATLGAVGVPLAFGDLNRDGLRDLVAEAHAEGRTFYTLALAQSDGTLGASQAFHQVQNYEGTHSPSVIGDFDQDGIAEFLRGRTIFKGARGGKFSCVGYRAPGEGVIGDLNGDGVLDFVHGTTVGGRNGVSTILGEP